MTPHAVQEKNQHIIEDFINKEPIGFDVTFPAPLVISGQCVVTILIFKRLSIRQFFHDGKKLIYILALLLRKLQILF